MNVKVLTFILFNAFLNVSGQNTTSDENIETTTPPPPKNVPTIFDVFIKGPPSVGIPQKSSPPPPPPPPSLPGGLEQFPGNPHVGIIRINKVPSPGPDFVHQGISPNSINNHQQQQQQPQQPLPEQPQSQLNPQQGYPPHPPLPQQTTAQQQTPAYLPNGYGLPYPYANNLPNQIPQFTYSPGIQNPNYSPYQGSPQDSNQKPINPGLDYQGNPGNNNINNNFYQRQPVSPYDRQLTGGTDTNNRQREGEPDLSTENIYTGAGQFPGQSFPVPFGPQQPPYPGFGNFGPTGQFPNFNPNFTGTSFGQNPNVNNNNNNNNNNGSNNNNNGIGAFPTSGFPDPRFNQGQLPTVGFYGPINGFGGNIPVRFTPQFGGTPLSGTNFNPQSTQ